MYLGSPSLHCFEMLGVHLAQSVQIASASHSAPRNMCHNVAHYKGKAISFSPNAFHSFGSVISSHLKKYLLLKTTVTGDTVCAEV